MPPLDSRLLSCKPVQVAVARLAARLPQQCSVPVGPLLVDKGEVLDDVGAVLAVTLARLALLYAGALALAKLPPTAAPLRPLEQPLLEIGSDTTVNDSPHVDVEAPGG